MQVFLGTERSILRRLTDDDAAQLCALDADPAVMRYRTGGVPTSYAVIRQENPAPLPSFGRGGYTLRLLGGARAGDGGVRGVVQSAPG